MFACKTRVLCLSLLLPATCATRGRGVDFNGPLLSGTHIGEAQLALVPLSIGVVLGDKTLTDVAVTGTELKGEGGEGFALSGALLLGQATDGTPVRLRIDGVAEAEDPRPETPDNELADVQLYTLSYQRGTFSGEGPARRFVPAGDPATFQPLCAEGKGALALAGRWDHGQGQPGAGGRRSLGSGEVTFACQDAALWKCVRLGYKPWKGAALARLHEACVRAVRADYCGTGVSMTQTGTEVDFYDPLGVQRDTRDWPFEAEWTPDGARCVSSPRQGASAEALVKKNCPERLRPRNCGPGKGAEEGVLYTERRP